MLKLVLIERDPAHSLIWKSISKPNRYPEFWVKEVIKRYHGFEGDIVDIFIQTDPVEKWPITDFLNLKALGNCILIFLVSGDTVMPPSLAKYAVKLGYDIGFCKEENGEMFSSIFHEVLFGRVQELVAFKEHLNEHFLIPEKLKR